MFLSFFSKDSTFEDGGRYMGRLINHGKGRHANVVPKIVEFNAKPQIVFFAKKNINLGDELLYDYGERRPEVIFENQFLK